MNKNLENKKNKNENLSFEHFPTNERLHTDVLEEKYGKIHVEVLRHNDKIRESHLVDKDNISRTYAITFLNNFESSEIKKIDNEIKKGALIGETFRKYGFSIRKNVIDVFTSKIPEWLKDKFSVDDDFAKIRLSEFYAKKRDGKPILYGIVAEIYSPDFRASLVNQFDDSQISALSEFLENEGIDSTEIWRRIGLDNDYHDLWQKLNNAKYNSLHKIEELKEKVLKIMYEKRN